MRVCLKRAARRILIGELARLAKGQVADGAGVAAGLARGRRHNRDPMLRAQKDSKGLGQKDAAALCGGKVPTRERLRAMTGRFRIARIGHQIGQLVRFGFQVMHLVGIETVEHLLVLLDAKHTSPLPLLPGSCSTLCFREVPLSNTRSIRLTKIGN